MGIRKTSSKTRIATSAPAATGVVDALFTKVQQRVLGVLFGNPGRSYYANELIGLAGSGTGAVQRELARLEAAGLATVTRVGKQKHYQANAAAPVYAELRGLVVKTSGMLDVMRAALLPLIKGISLAFVYGSDARAQDTAASDIDLMVINETLTYGELFEALESATLRLGRTVNPTVYTRTELDKRIRRGNAFVQRVLSQPKLWVIGQHLDLAA